MAEELRFFLRTVVYTAAITAVYWFMSYERAGTVLFIAVVVSALLLIVIVAVTARASRAGTKSPKALVGFGDEGVSSEPLAIEEEVFPAASGTPLWGALAATLVLTGLIYGAWLWIPGAALGAATLVTWASTRG